MMFFLVVANRDAGSTDDLDRALDVLGAAGELEVVWTQGPDDIDRVLERGDGTLVIAGGDGSIHLVVNRLHRMEQLARPVGILPLGTGNDLARGLGLPLDPEEAARRLIAASPRRLPLLAAPGGEVAVNNAHVGLGVAAARRGAEWKDHLGPLAYKAGAAAAGLGYDGFGAIVAVDGQTVHDGGCLALMVLVGPSAGGGFRPLEDVDIGDPLCDVLVVGDEAGRAQMAIAAARGRVDETEGVDRYRGESVVASVDGEEWELDGEFRTWDDPVDLSIDGTWTALL